MTRKIKLIETIDHDSSSLPLFRDMIDIPITCHRRYARKFLKMIRLNKYVETILERMPDLAVEAWLTSGCLVQTAWNVKTRQRPHAGIDDYDLIYFDPDISWEAEDNVIQRTEKLFSDLDIDIQIRNQARVPIWYADKFNIQYPPVREAPHALLRYPSRTTAIAVTRRESGEDVFYAPFGFSDALKMRIRPNHRLNIPDVYESKARRWQSVWPELSILPWDTSDDGVGPDTQLKARAVCETEDIPLA